MSDQSKHHPDPERPANTESDLLSLLIKANYSCTRSLVMANQLMATLVLALETVARHVEAKRDFSESFTSRFRDLMSIAALTAEPYLPDYPLPETSYEGLKTAFQRRTEQTREFDDQLARVFAVIEKEYVRGM